VSVEQRILNFIEEGCDKPSWEGKELRAIALEVRKREDRIKQLEDRIRRASIAFFEDGSDASVASGMLAILEEERRKVSKEPLQSDSSIWAKAGIGFTAKDKL
jgi:hypothetical protein